jgi:hypothetical protein
MRAAGTSPSWISTGKNSGAERDRLDPILDTCVARYGEELDEDGHVDFEGKAKAFLRTYDFLAAILPYTNAEWEKLSIFLNFFVPKLPAPQEEDLSRGTLEAIDMDSYRVEKRAAMRIQLPDAEGEIGPVPASGGGGRPEPVSSTGSASSSPPSTSSSATSSGRTPIVFSGSSPRRSRRRWLRTRPFRMQRRTPTRRTPG